MKPFSSDNFLELLNVPTYEYALADPSNVVRLADDIEIIAPKIELFSYPDRIDGFENRRRLIGDGYELLGAEAFYIFWKSKKLMPSVFKKFTNHDKHGPHAKIFFDGDILLLPYYKYKVTLALYRDTDASGRLSWRYETDRMDSFRSEYRTSAVYRK